MYFTYPILYYTDTSIIRIWIKKDYTFIYYLHLFTYVYTMCIIQLYYIFCIDLGLYTNLLYFIISCTLVTLMLFDI